MRPVLFHIGGFAVYSYGVMLFLAFLAAIFVARAELNRRGLDGSAIYLTASVAAITGVVGARIFYVLGNLEHFSGNWGQVFDLNMRGLVFYGGLALAVPSCILLLRRMKLPPGAVADAVGLGSAADYLRGIGLERIRRHEQELTQRMVGGLSRIRRVRLIGVPREKAGVVTFLVDGMEPEHVAQRLDAQGIAIRSGHHCAQPIHRKLGVASSSRASLGVASTPDDVDRFLDSLTRVRPFFGLSK